MRTAVVRLNVDPAGTLTVARLTEGMAALLDLVRGVGADMVGDVVGHVVGQDLTSRPAGRREVELLIDGDDAESAKLAAIELCGKAFQIQPEAGVVTFISRGTDDDAHGVLAAFGLTGEIVREPGDDGYDIVHVLLREADLERVPESRIHTALEASLNCEVRIRTS